MTWRKRHRAFARHFRNLLCNEAYQRIAGAKSGLAWITTDPIQSLPGMRTLDLGCWPAVIHSSPPVDVTCTRDGMSAECATVPSR